MTTSFETAGDALLAFADGPGQQAAEKLEQAFALAGENIERALGQAARSGQLNFEDMVANILRDLTALAAQSVLNGSNTSSQTINLNMNLGQGTDAQSVLNARGAITASLASAVQSGTRFL